MVGADPNRAALLVEKSAGYLLALRHGDGRRISAQINDRTASGTDDFQQPPRGWHLLFDHIDPRCHHLGQCAGHRVVFIGAAIVEQKVAQIAGKAEIAAALRLGRQRNRDAALGGRCPIDKDGGGAGGHAEGAGAIVKGGC